VQIHSVIHAAYYFIAKQLIMYLIQLTDQHQQQSGMFWALTSQQFAEIVTTGMPATDEMVQAQGSNQVLTCTAVQYPLTGDWLKGITPQEAADLYAACDREPGPW
jgi:hypothetical protein